MCLTLVPPWSRPGVNSGASGLPDPNYGSDFWCRLWGIVQSVHIFPPPSCDAGENHRCLGANLYRSTRPVHCPVHVQLVRHLEGRAVFWPRLPMIVNPRCGNVGVTEPFLYLGDIRLMIERIGGGRGTQRVGANLKSQQG
jgi:hypothetical protein